MEEQPGETFGVGVETERIRALDELGDVAWEDHDEECGDDPADRSPMARDVGEDERETERDLDHARDDDHDVGIEGEPVGNLSLKLLALGREVRQSGPDECRAEQPPPECSHEFTLQV